MAQSFYQDTFTAPSTVVTQIKKAKEMYTNDSYMTIRHFFDVIDTINSEGHYELFEHQPHTFQLLFGDLINWLYVRDDDVDDQDDWYAKQSRQSYSEKASYREWCLIKYMFGEINVIEEDI